MKTKNNPPPWWFGVPPRPARFEQPAEPPAPFRSVQETQFERLKGRVIREILDGEPAGEFSAPLRRAANEAAALAWQTGYPLLVFPALAEEKSRTARLQAQRQARIRQRSREMMVQIA